MAKPRADERELALLAVWFVRLFGGVLEHPVRSQLWQEMRLPAPGEAPDLFGGWTLRVNQHWFGHRAEKATLLYIVGCSPAALPPIQPRLDEPTHVVGTSGRRRDGSRAYRPELTKAEREHTPPEMAAWLVELARRCRVRH